MTGQIKTPSTAPVAYKGLIDTGIGIDGWETGQSLLNRLNEVHPSESFPFDITKNFLARKDPDQTYRTYTFEGFSVFSQDGQFISVPTMQFVNYSSSEIETINTIFAIIKYQAENGTLPATIQQVFDHAVANGETLLSIGTRGTAGSTGGQAWPNDQNNSPDGDFETTVLTGDLTGGAESYRQTALIDRIFHEFSHYDFSHADLANPANGVLGNLDIITLNDILPGDQTYQGGDEFVHFIADTVSQNDTITVDGKTFDLTKIKIDDNSIDEHFYGSSHHTGVANAAAERYENTRRLLVSQKLTKYHKELEEGQTPAETLTEEQLGALEQQGLIKVIDPDGDRSNLLNYKVKRISKGNLVDYDGDGKKSGWDYSKGKPEEFNYILAARELFPDDVSFQEYLDATLNNIFEVDGGELGKAFGTVLGNRLTDDPFLQVISSGTLSTFIGAIGEYTQELLKGGASTAKILDSGWTSFSTALKNNIVGAGVGSLSSYLTAELFDVLDLEGTLAQAGESVASSYISAIIGAIPDMIGGDEDALSDALQGVNVPSILGSFVGSKLAQDVGSFGTVGGQIGSSVGGIYGSVAATGALADLAAVSGIATEGLSTAQAALAFAAENPVAAVVVVAAIVCVDTLIGGLIGSLFGGTPRASADVSWDEANGQFVVENLYSKHGGSREAAYNISSYVANTYNSVLEVTGSKLLDADDVQTGNYGMRKKDFVYRPIASKDKHDISATFSSAEELIDHGIYHGLSDMVDRSGRWRRVR